MKKVIFLELIKKLQSKPQVMRKLKVFVALGLVGLFIVGGLAIWAGISTFKYLIASASQVISSPTTQGQRQDVKAELLQIQFQPLNCWGEAQTLMTVQAWLEKSALENLRDLKTACLDSKPAPCEGPDCSQVKQFINIDERTTI